MLNACCFLPSAQTTAGLKMIGMQVPTRKGAILTAVRVTGKLGSRNLYEWRCSVCSDTDRELFAPQFMQRTITAVKAGAPCGCTRRPQYAEQQMAIRASRLVAESGWGFLGWAGPYLGNKTKCRIYCQKHGESIGTTFSNLSRGSGCPRCRLDARNVANMIGEDEHRSRCAPIVESRGWALSEPIGPYFGQDSRVAVKCPKHGRFESSYGPILQGNYGCPDCWSNGFNRNKESVLYCLKSRGGAYIKIGVTGDLMRRLKQLWKCTPFDFDVIDYWIAPGEAVWQQEKAFHASYETAGLVGFSGCSEWLKADKAIVHRFSLLPAPPSI